MVIRLCRIKFREISSWFLLETDFRFEFLVRKYECAENFKYILSTYIFWTRNSNLKSVSNIKQNLKFLEILIEFETTVFYPQKKDDGRRYYQKTMLAYAFKGSHH